MIRIEPRPYIDLRRQVKVVQLDGLDANDGLVSMRQVVPPEKYQLRPHFYLDSELALPATKEKLNRHFRPVIFPAVRAVTLSDTIVTGNGCVLTNHGGLLRESAFEWFNFDGMPPNFYRLQSGAMLHAPATGRYLPGSYLLLKQIPNPVNFGHWLIEGAAMAALMKNTILEDSLSLILPTSADMRMSEVLLSTVLAVLPSQKPIRVFQRDVSEAWQVDRLVFATSLHVPPLKSRVGITALRDSVLSSLRPLGTPCKKRWFVARNANTRRLLNEDQIFEYLREYGFEMLMPEQLSFTEQVRAFNTAEIVIGAKGAGLSSMLFMPEGSHVLSLSPSDFPDPFFWDVAACLPIEYSEIYGDIHPAQAGRSPGFKDFAVDAARVGRFCNLLGIG